MKALHSLLTPILLLVALVGVTSCTHNDGDIGLIYGNWKVTSVEYDNVPDATPYEGGLFFQFQNTTVGISATSDLNEEIQCFGNFRVEDNTMFLDFPDDRFPWDAQLFIIPRQCELQILQYTTANVTLMYHPTLESSITLHLRRW